MLIYIYFRLPGTIAIPQADFFNGSPASEHTTTGRARPR
jgi:hypothetical protein